MKRFLTGNHGAAEAVRLCRPQLVAAYPITPQTPIYEKLSDWDAAGTLGGRMMRVESEHSAMAACISACLTGIRTFTATSSQGIALMHEMLHYASGCRAPVVMACVNRSLAAPWAFWSDQTDSLSQRDTGWIQYYPENNQDVFDTIIQAYRVAEEVLLPVMVNLEANFISHFMEPIEVPDAAAVDAFLPPPSLPQRFDTEAPGFVIPTVNQAQFQHFRRLADEAMAYAGSVIDRVDRDFAGHFGRGYGTLETVQCEDADLVLVTTGTITSTARTALKKLRADGPRVGLLKLRVFRPFPVDALLAALPPLARIAVIERSLSLGREGIFCSELKSTLANSREPRWVQGYLAGIGGTNVNPELIERVARDALERTEPQERPIWVTEEEP